MKKVLFAVLALGMGLLIASSASAIVTAKGVKGQVKSAPTKVEIATVKSATPASPSAPTIVGAYASGTGFDGMLKTQVSKDMSLLFGGSITTSSAAGAANQLRLTLVGHKDVKSCACPVKAHWVGGLQYTSNAGNAAGTNILGVSLGWGVTTSLASNVSLVADINILQYASVTAPAASFTTWTLLAPTMGVFYTF